MTSPKLKIAMAKWRYQPASRCGIPFCICDVCVLAIGDEHRAADNRCGREWSCQCGSCRRARQLELLAIRRRLRRLDDLQRTRAAVALLKAAQGAK